MENKYIEAVLAKPDGSDKICLFGAPRGTYLRKGDRITIEPKNGEIMATVVASKPYWDIKSENFGMLMAATEATFPLRRVLSKIQVVDIEYGEEEKELWQSMI